MDRISKIERRVVDLYNKIMTTLNLATAAAQVYIPQITITTSTGISTTTKSAAGIDQIGRNVIVENGASAINYTVNATDGFVTTIVKNGTGAITFVAGSGRTLTVMDGTAILNGAPGSRATIISSGTVDKLYITNY